MSSSGNDAIGLRPGDWVEVRSEAEILATLAADATLDGLPFMPEMRRYCGQRFRVYRRADKTCDTVGQTGGLKLRNAVHLLALRCDGSGHGGCEAGCLMFWREAWLKRVDAEGTAPAAASPPAPATGCTVQDVERAAVVDAATKHFRCQIINLKDFTEPLPWWDARQYVRDVAINDVKIGTVLRAFFFSAYRTLTEIGIGYRALTGLYDWVQAKRGGAPWPLRTGKCEKTPTQILSLQPGEMVRVRPYQEILATLDRNNKNRGLWFDAEMVQYCGNTYRVTRRVTKILDEKTGKMLEFSNPCIVLQDLVCRATKTKHRLFCPRNIPIYWREIWLERVVPAATPASVGEPARATRG